MGKAPTRFLIVSLGSIGRRHLRNLRAMNPDAEIAILRLSGTKSDQYVQGANVVTASIDEAIRFAPHAAIVASPASTHADIACKLAERGIHLLIEKPLACDVTSANRIALAAQKSGVTCMVGYNLRFKPSLIEVRNLLTAGRIGKVLSVRAEVGQYLPSWRPEQDYRTGVSAQANMGGGALLELSHELDYLIWLFGMPDRVHCTMGRYSDLEIDVEDLVNLTMEYDEPGRLIDVHLDFLQRKAVRHCRFIGSAGTMTWDAIADTVRLEGMADGDQDQSIGPFEADGNKAYLAEIDHFIHAIVDTAQPEPDAAAGRDILTVVEAARLSAASGSTVKMERIENGC
ncbi:MAG: Gfo/Idh/MocA family protein [Sphingorhabdus sp.]